MENRRWESGSVRKRERVAEQKMTEAEIRDRLIKELALSPAGLGATFIPELFVDGFSRRADLVMANGKLSVFEIKSPRDSLDRLDGQVESYCKFFEQVTVVCAPKHLAGVMARAPETVGVWTINDDGSQIVRKAKCSSPTSKANWLSFLPVLELRRFLRAQGGRALGSRADLVEQASRQSVSVIRASVLCYLKRRHEHILALKQKQRASTRHVAKAEPSQAERLAEYISKSGLRDAAPIPRQRAI